ncbi:MAG: diguanylate cyclase [Gaiellaceae bacterium]
MAADPLETAPEPPPHVGRASARRHSLVDSYRLLAGIFHEVLSEQTLDSLLDRIADTLADLVPYDSLTMYQADETRRDLFPVLVRSTEWRQEIFRNRPGFGEGITGWAVEHRRPVLTNAAHLDRRVVFVPGTPPDPEALIAVPLIARGSVKGSLNIYRDGADAHFDQEEFELAKRFGDAAALALDNAQIRAHLEHQAQTDSLTGLYNHRYFYDRLRAELHRVSRARDSVSLLMLDLDDFKRVNDVYGHGVGDQVLVAIAELIGATVRTSDVACRVGGEEFAVIMSSCEQDAAHGLAVRLTEELARRDIGPASGVTLSIGIAEGPRHAINPRELVACADAAMLTAKARGKDQIVLFDEGGQAGPEHSANSRGEVRSLAHLKLLQTVSTKLSALRRMDEIGGLIATELRGLLDYHNCRVYRRDGDDLIPVAFRGDGCSDCEQGLRALRCKVGHGITGRVAQTGKSMLVANTLASEFARQVEGTDVLAESMLAVPLRAGPRVIGVIVLSQVGEGVFDEDDERLLEMVAGHASVALENARLYEAARSEAELARGLLEFGRRLCGATSLETALALIAEMSASMLGSPKASVWLQDEDTGEMRAHAVHGHSQRERETVLAERFTAKDAERFLAAGEPVVVQPDERAEVGAADPVEAMAVGPILLAGGRLACIAASAPVPGPYEFSPAALRLLAGIADQAKLALTSLT